MKYLGSKARIAKHILPIILANRTEGQWYVEPFCGGCNSLDKVDGRRIGNDRNEYLIAMFKALGNGWVPTETVSKDTYNEVKANKYQYAAEFVGFVGFVGFVCSYCGKWFGGYAYDYPENRRNKNGVLPNFQKETRGGLLKQSPLLDSVLFFSGSYDSFPIPSNSIIYCDPPYYGTTKYRDAFNHSEFWHWCRRMKTEGHTVFVSEYSAPPDFTCVWKGEQTTTISRGDGKRAVERLYVLQHT